MKNEEKLFKNIKNVIKQQQWQRTSTTCCDTWLDLAQYDNKRFQSLHTSRFNKVNHQWDSISFQQFVYKNQQKSKEKPKQICLKFHILMMIIAVAACSMQPVKATNIFWNQRKSWDKQVACFFQWALKFFYVIW